MRLLRLFAQLPFVVFLRKKLLELRFPPLRVKAMPKTRPSVESIYFLINQLGKGKPRGLTHREGVAYHELPFHQLKLRTSRSDLKQRLARISSVYDIQGSYGLDVGCAVGGLTFGLQFRGAQMLGVDRDNPSLQVARECESYFNTGANFLEGDFSTGLLREALAKHGNPETGRFDFAVWFSSFNWVLDALGPAEIVKLLSFFSQSVDVLIADSAIGGKGADAMRTAGIQTNEEFAKFVIKNSHYLNVTPIGFDSDWYGRESFMFSR